MKPVPKITSGKSAPGLYPDASDGKTQPKRRRGRPPGSGTGPRNTEYERARIREVESHAELFELRIRKLRGELLDRAMLAREMDAIFSAIKEVILGLPISEHQKADALQNLTSIPAILDNVAEKQNQVHEKEPMQNGHSELGPD